MSWAELPANTHMHALLASTHADGAAKYLKYHTCVYVLVCINHVINGLLTANDKIIQESLAWHFICSCLVSPHLEVFLASMLSPFS